MSEIHVGGMRAILVATDFSFTADRALEHARSLAARARADLVVVHVKVPDRGEGDSEGLLDWDIEPETVGCELEGRMRRLLGDVERSRCVVRTGRTAEVIVAEAAAVGADSIVIGADGLDGRRRPHLGSTVRRVIESAPCPVLVVHWGDAVRGERPLRILAATDFSVGARFALERAARLLDVSSADTLVLAHAYDVPPTISLAVARFTRPDIDGLVREEAARQLAREADTLRRAGLSPRPELLEGLAASAIVSHARTLDADLIVVGTLGRTGLAHLLLGSTAERVVERAPCPVLVVPAASAAAAAEHADRGEAGSLAGVRAL